MDIEKIKMACITHFEKAVLAAIVVVSGLLIYRGMQLPDFTDEKKPEQLTQEANTVKRSIDDDHTENIIQPRRPEPGKSIVARTRELYKAVDPTTYKLSKIWIGETSADTIIRRQDPLLLPPMDLRTTGVVCSIAANGAREPGDYPLARLDPAPELKAESSPSPRERERGRNRGRRGRDSIDSEPSGIEDAVGLKRLARRGEAETKMSGRQFDSSNSLGYTPSSIDTDSGSGSYPQPKIGWFIAGTALLPHREIYEAYELALKDAGDYNPSRDTPLYFDFEVQRADVTVKPVDRLTEQDWSKVYDRSLYTKIADTVWQGFAPEIVPEDYRDENITMWIPPVLLDDYSFFALHPRIPLLSKAELKEKEMMALQANDRDFTDIEDLDQQFSEVELAVPGGGGSGTRGGLDRSGSGDEFVGGATFSDGEIGLFSRGQLEEDPVEHKLIRFYDFGIYPSKARAGRRYSYRIRYAVIDPNFPASIDLQPSLSKLAPDVAQRVQGKLAIARETGKRNFRYWSDWSEPTAPASLPVTRRVAAGSLDNGNVRSYEVDGRLVPVARELPSAKVLLSEFNFDLGVRVPAVIQSIKEGGVLSKRVDNVEVIDPITNEVKTLKDANVDSSISLVDLDGGMPLQIVEDLTSPGLMLLYDSQGRLSVTNDVDDQREYRVYTFADEREALK